MPATWSSSHSTGAAQGCIDLAHHIVADDGLRVPQTYRAAFDSLLEAGWIEPDLAARLASWAGLRNVIAHGYLAIDLKLVCAAIAERVSCVASSPRWRPESPTSHARPQGGLFSP